MSNLVDFIITEIDVITTKIDFIITKIVFRITKVDFTNVQVLGFILSVIVFIVGLKAYLNFKKRNLFDQWISAQGGIYYDNEYTVKELIDTYKDPSILIFYIKLKKNQVAVEYILDYFTIKATGVKQGLINQKLAIKLGKNDVIYFYEGLLPWINELEKKNCGSYDDLKDFYRKCKVEECRCNYKTSLESNKKKRYWYIPKPIPWIKLRFYCMDEKDRCKYIKKKIIYYNIPKPCYWKTMLRAIHQTLYKIISGDF